MIRLGVQVHNGVPFLVGRAEDFAEVWGMVTGGIGKCSAFGGMTEGAKALGACNDCSFGIWLPDMKKDDLGVMAMLMEMVGGTD
jgi:hypothetical protein